MSRVQVDHEKSTVDPTLALEAKMIVSLAFRNGPIEDLHAGCCGREKTTVRLM